MYGFYGRLKSEFPSQIIVDITENCNYACLHCPHANFQKSDVYTGAFLKPDLNNKMVDEVAKYGRNCTQQIRYTANGEPLLHPKVYEMLSYAVEKSGVMVSLTTNGSLLNDCNINRLLDTGIGLIDISLDAYSREVYEQIRINGVYDKVKQNVLNLLAERYKRKQNTRIVVSFVLQELNKHEAKDFENYWYNQGIDYVVIRQLHTAGGANEVHLDESSCGERKPCVYPWERIVLSAKGELGFCPASWQGETEICEYEQTTIKSLWQSDYYRRLREGHLQANLSDFVACNKCQDWRVINWPEHGRGYGDMIADFSKKEE